MSKKLTFLISTLRAFQTSQPGRDISRKLTEHIENLNHTNTFSFRVGSSTLRHSISSIRIMSYYCSLQRKWSEKSMGLFGAARVSDQSSNYSLNSLATLDPFDSCNTAGTFRCHFILCTCQRVDQVGGNPLERCYFSNELSPILSSRRL